MLMVCKRMVRVISRENDRATGACGVEIHGLNGVIVKGMVVVVKGLVAKVAVVMTW